MEELLKTDLEGKYRKYIETVELSDEELKTEFLELLEIQDPVERTEKWKKMKVFISSFKELVHLANPYYIGYGNPSSKILFVGKEKAFNLYHHPELFIQESVNNTLHWKLIGQSGDLNPPQMPEREMGFNPAFPKSYFTNKFRLNHTWGSYAKIVAGITGTGDPGALLNETQVYKNSFFNKCFTTEVNHIPSRYSENRKLTTERQEFLKHPFFRSFSTVIIGAKGYLDDKQITDLFEAEPKIEEIELEPNGKRTGKTIKLYTNKHGQRIIYCNQLSGAAGWSSEAMAKLVEIAKIS